MPLLLRGIIGDLPQEFIRRDAGVACMPSHRADVELSIEQVCDFRPMPLKKAWRDACKRQSTSH